ncbi:hypothetical protein F443_11319 [Plasmopara halstedii]|uniref:FYVE-type domain-containing protein n=1 Tax=Plasmopara halstedii TaxID=4781 RepID=A0A0P1A975_PLAHL|nr:hypothetical protein F443_11319 [Plasmopara halstedii]CEG36772.1 hypothetical protein F443_11319 [Plasmopara halstedii]|eukprot:XP_024573141.1 hypothetical protein F443_11319 [Plasmopara halstedii]
MRGPNAYKSNIAEVGCKGQLSASLDQVGRAYAAHEDALFKRLMKKLNPAVMDAAVLLTIVPRTPLTPFRYIGIKWYAVKTPTPIVSHRDYCCLEVQDKIVDSFGNEMYIRVLNSIEINECPSLENSHGLVRAKILAGYMYRLDRAEPNVVRVHHVGRFNPGGYFPAQWAFKTAESQLMNSVVQICRIIDKQQMIACTFVDKRQWVPNHERLHCAVCSRAFGTFRPRHHCRSCGEVICGKCSVFKSVEVPGTTLKNVRICSVCNMGVQKASGQDEDGNMSDISTSSITSTSTIAQNEMNLMDLYMANGGGSRTPSAYSDASAHSNLSIRSTTSMRSTYDARGRKHSRARGARNIMGFFNESNTPRSYIANNLTPRSTLGPGGSTPHSGANSTATTPSAGSRPSNSAATVVAAAAITAQRLSSFKQNPVDIGYLRDSVHEISAIVETRERPEDPTVVWPPAKIQRLETEETADVDMESDDQEMIGAKSAEPSARGFQQEQQRSLVQQLPTVERISESHFEHSSCASTNLCTGINKEDFSTSFVPRGNGSPSISGFRPFLSGIISRVRGDSVDNFSRPSA